MHSYINVEKEKNKKQMYVEIYILHLLTYNLLDDKYKLSRKKKVK